MVTAKEKAVAALDITLAVGDCIRDLGEVPSGHLYVRVMDRIKIDDYNTIIKALKGAGVVEEKNNVLKWIGPALQPSN